MKTLTNIAWMDETRKNRRSVATCVEEAGIKWLAYLQKVIKIQFRVGEEYLSMLIVLLRFG